MSDAEKLKMIVIGLIKRVPAAAAGSAQKRQELLAIAIAAQREINGGNLYAANARIAEFRAAEAAPIEDAQPPPQSVARASAPAIPPVVPLSSPNASPAPSVPAAQPAAPVAQPAAAQPAAPVAQPAAPVARPWDAARQEASNQIGELRKLFNKAVKFEPYLSDLIQYDQLYGRITKVADILDKQVGDGDKLADVARIRAYQVVAAEARTAAAGFDQQIKATQGKVAAQRYGLATDDDKKALLGQLAGSRDGRQIIDGMVARVGGSAKTDRDKQFVKEALKARYKIDELAGDMSTKALPKFYKLLGMVPEAHTTGNDSLKKITRNSGLLDAFRQGAVGRYLPGSKEIEINLPKSCLPSVVLPPFTRLPFDLPLPFTQKTAAGERNWYDGFSFATLHEIGHSVDDKLGFMRGKEGNPNYGGWETESVDTIADKAGELKGFYSAFEAFPKKVLKRFLTAVLSTGTPPDPGKFIETAQSEANDIGRKRRALDTAERSEDLLEIDRKRQGLVDRGATQPEWNNAYEEKAGKNAPKPRSDDPSIIGIYRRLANSMLDFNQKKSLVVAAAEQRELLGAVPAVPRQANLETMATHPAVAWCTSIRNQFWGAGPGGAAAVALSNGRVYQQVEANNWTSYSLASRSDGVSNYQFRASGEWFAELYAHYYLKKLPQSHPAYGWFKATIDVDDGAA